MRSVLAASALIACLASPALAAEAPVVVATIKPMHSLVAGVMSGVGEPYLLIKGAASPHTYQMRPSDARMLDRAAVVFWVGEGLEAFLRRPLAALAGNARVVALADVSGVVLLKPREGGAWERPQGQGHQASHNLATNRGGAYDPHFWLDPHNAVAMVDGIAAALAKADAGNATAYRANAKAVKARLMTLDGELKMALAPIRHRPYVVFHDAYQYLEARYGLAPAGSITVSPEIAASAGRIAEIRRKINESGAACVFAEPQFEPKVTRLVAEGSGARIASLDPLGADLSAGPELYFELIRRDARTLRACLELGS